MADNRFKFKLLTGADPQAQYDAIATKDPYTFYLSNTGFGFLGSVPLFGGGTQKTVVMTSGTITEHEAGKLYVLHGVTYGDQTLTGLYLSDGATLSAYSDELMANWIATNAVKSMIAAEGEDAFTGDDETVATTKAIVDLINNKLDDSSLINAAFFRHVTNHTLTAEDLTNENISVPEGAKEGDLGLLFTADTDAEDGGEKYYFVSVKNLVTIYGAEDSTSVKMSLTADNKFKAELNIAADETSLIAGDNGVYIDKATTINDGEGVGEGDIPPSETKLVTEKALVDYIINAVLPAVDSAITEALKDVVTYTEDNGTTEDGGDVTT